jgi:O-antigen ligase
MRLFALVGVAAALCTIVVVFAIPVQGIDLKEGSNTAWQGIFNHKNDCGIVLSYLLTGVVLSPHLRRFLPKFRLISIGVILLVIVMSESRTGWILAAAFFAYSTAVRVAAKFSTASRRFLYLFATLVSIAVVALLVWNASTFFIAIGKSANASGRTEIWATALRSVWKRPFLGYGYHAFFLGMQGESANTATVWGAGVPMGQAQSGYLENWLELGVVGLGLIVFTIVIAAMRGVACLVRGNSAAAEWYLAVVLLTVVANIGERNLLHCNFLDWVMYVMAYIGLSREARVLRVTVSSAMRCP